MDFITVDRNILSKKPLSILGENCSKKTNFESVLEQKHSKNRYCNSQPKAISSKTNQYNNSQKISNESIDRITNRSKDDAKPLVQKKQLQQCNMQLHDMEDEDFTQNVDFNLISAILSLLEGLNQELQDSVIQKNLGFEIQNEINDFNEQLSSLYINFNKMIKTNNKELFQENLTDILKELELLSTKTNLKFDWTQLQTALLEFKESIVSENEKSIRENIISMNTANLKDWKNDKTDKSLIGDIKLLADGDAVSSKIKIDFSNLNRDTEFSEKTSIANDHFDVEFIDILKRLEGLFRNQTMTNELSDAKEISENIPVETNNLSNFNNYFSLENKTVIPNKLNFYHILTQITESSDVLVHKNGSEMHLQLQPEHLGKLSMKIAVEKGIVIANIIAENQIVKEILESNFNLLKDALNEKGLGIQEFHVSVGQESNAREYNNFMKSRVKNPRKGLLHINKNEYLKSDSVNPTVSLYATRIDYLG